MAAYELLKVINTICFRNPLGTRLFHKTAPLTSVQAGKFKPTKNRSKRLTYEQANPPPQIAHKKSWNSWNTTTLEGGLRTATTAIEDSFIRKFMMGTFPKLIISEIIIKRQHNIIRISAIVLIRQNIVQFAFLIGYTEEFLGHWLQAPVKLELQFVQEMESVTFKCI